MRGWSVVTGAESWTPQLSAPRAAAVAALMPAAPAAADGPAPAPFMPPQHSAVVSTGGPDRGSPAGSLPAPRDLTPVGSGRAGSLSFLDQHLQSLAQGLFVGSAPLAAAGTVATAEGHSSGRSGSGHLDPAIVKKEATAAPRTASAAAAAAGGAYQLRTRSSSLRQAWVEAEAEEEEEEEEEGEAATADIDSEASDDDSEDEAPPSRKTKLAAGKSGRASAAKTGNPSTRPSRAAATKAAPSEAPAGAAERPQRESGPAGGSGRSARRKVVGRPVTAPADPADPELTEQERRKIRRRIANRESARRVRAKRAELMDELQIKVTSLSQQNSRLVSHVALVEGQKAMLAQQVAVLGEKLAEKHSEAVVLYNQIFQLRKHLSPETVAQVEREAAASTPPPSGPHGGVGMAHFMPVTPSAPATTAAAPATALSLGLGQFPDLGLPGMSFLA